MPFIVGKASFLDGGFSPGVCIKQEYKKHQHFSVFYLGEQQLRTPGLRLRNIQFLVFRNTLLARWSDSDSVASHPKKKRVICSAFFNHRIDCFHR